MGSEPQPPVIFGDGGQMPMSAKAATLLEARLGGHIRPTAICALSARLADNMHRVTGTPLPGGIPMGRLARGTPTRAVYPTIPPQEHP